MLTPVSQILQLHTCVLETLLHWSDVSLAYLLTSRKQMAQGSHPKEKSAKGGLNGKDFDVIFVIFYFLDGLPSQELIRATD